MPKDAPIILPEKYYLDYFLYLIAFLERHYDHVLAAPEQVFLADFKTLSEGAKCLYIRLVNRRGLFFRRSKIKYLEITDLDAAQFELEAQGFLAVNESFDPAQLALFTKKELVGHFPFLSTGQRKNEILAELSEEDVGVIHEVEKIIEVKRGEVVSFLKLLFFGNPHQQMTEFVIRDVGNIKLPSLNEEKFTPWFQSREDALAVMHLSQLRPTATALMREGLLTHELLQQIPWSEWTALPRAKTKADKLLLDIGYYFEKNNQLAEALAYYHLTSQPPAGERKIRIYEKMGQREKACRLSQELIAHPANATELTFAMDYLSRSGIRISRSMSRRLKEARVIDLERQEGKIEQQVLAWMEAQGWEGTHSENYLWKSLFGLTFWDVLFDQDFGAFHHPLQRAPSDLYDDHFFKERAASLQERLDQIKTRKSYTRQILTRWEEQYGNANRFVSWHEKQPDYLEKMIDYLPLKSIKAVLLEMARQAKENSTGFPDLFVWRGADYHFYEVKSPNDHLSAQQLFWINFLSEVGIAVDILKVNYLP